MSTDARTHAKGLWASAVAVLLAALFGASDVTAEDKGGEHEYVGVARCRSCHRTQKIGNQIGAWEETKHAKAYETLASEKSKEWAAKAGVADPQADERCVKCHVTAYGVPKERLGIKFKLEDGVQCEACHGPGSDYRKKKVMIDRELALANGLVIPNEETCTGCHNEQSPAWDPEKYTRPDGTKVGFDYEQAVSLIAHPVPEDYDPTGEGEAD